MHYIENLSIKKERKISKNITWYLTVTLLAVFSVLPFFQEYATNNGVYIAKYGVLALFILVLFNVIKYRVNGVKLILFTSYLLLISSFSMFNSQDHTSTLTHIAIYSAAGILAVFLFPKISFEKFKSILSIFIIITFLLVTLPALFSIGDTSLYTNYGNRYRYLGDMNNPNMLGRLSLLGFLLSIRLWPLWKGFFKKSFLLFMFTSNIYLIYLSDSRASLVVVFLVIIALLIILLYKILPLYVFMSATIIASTVPVLLLLLLLNGQSINLDVTDLTSGRTTIWTNMFYGIAWNELMFGLGGTEGQGSHSGYLEIIRYFGILGFITWMIIILYLLIKKWKSSFKSANRLIGLGIVLSFLIYHLVEGNLVSLANLASIYFWLEISQRNT